MRNTKKAPKLSFTGARAKLARIQSEIETVADYLHDAGCEAEENELIETLEPVGNIDFMLEQLQ